MPVPLPFPRPPLSASSRRGFTLVEMLVAATVMTMLVLMIAGLMRGASSTIATSGRHLDADGQARQVLDQIQMDLARMLKRTDIYFQFAKQAGNDQFTFYCETPGLFATGVPSSKQSNLSLLCYRFDDAYQLERLDQGCQWTDVTFSPTAVPVLEQSNFQVLSSSVFRMEIAFLLRDGDTSLLITGTPPTPGSQAFRNLAAIIVAIAVFDSNSQKLIGSGHYPKLISALPDFNGTQSIPLGSTSSPIAGTIDPILSVWHGVINAPNFAEVAGIPPLAAQQVRIYQRIIYLQ